MTYQGGLQVVSFISLGLFLSSARTQVDRRQAHRLASSWSFNALVALADTAAS